MEIRSILVATVTIYCGLYYLTNDLDEGAKIVLFIVMIITNLYFLIFWLIKMSDAGMNMAREKINCLRSLIRANKVQDGYSDDLTVNSDWTTKTKVINHKNTLYQICRFNDLDDLKRSDEYNSEIKLFANMD